MTNLNDDIIAHIMLCFKMNRVNDCFRLALTCRQFYNCLQKNKTQIDDHFTHVMIDGDTETHYYGNKKHRNNDKPAIIWLGGGERWYHHGLLHRDGDLPAVICADGSQQWCKYGKVHRDGDLPASIRDDGTRIWYQYGVFHRSPKTSSTGTDNDLPAIIYPDGTQSWYKHDKRYEP